jgi:hypothetical protein
MHSQLPNYLQRRRAGGKAGAKVAALDLRCNASRNPIGGGSAESWAVRLPISTKACPAFDPTSTAPVEAWPKISPIPTETNEHGSAHQASLEDIAVLCARHRGPAARQPQT